MNAEQIAHALGGAKKFGLGWHALCPAHDDRKPSLKLDDRDGRVLVKCFAGCPQAAILDELKARGLWDGHASSPSIATYAPTAATRDNSERARALWQEAQLNDRTLVQTYLRSRGITVPAPATLRFVPLLNHSRAGEQFPVMLAAVARWPGKKVIAVQRTYLRRDGSGKASVDPAKMSLGPVKGGAVRLAPAGERLGLAEGVEDALSVMQAEVPRRFMLVWSAAKSPG